MNKKILIAGIVALLLIGIIYFLGFSTSPDKKSAKDGGEKTMDRIGPGDGGGVFSSGGNYPDDYASLFKDVDFPDYLEFREALRTGKANFNWELWTLREKCTPEDSVQVCNDKVLAFIESKYQSPDKEAMKELFTNYFRYEDEIRRLENKGSFDERYELIRKKRREYFKDEDAKVVFGMEEAQFDFMSASKEFMDSSKSQSGPERVKNYEALKKKTYGPFYESITQREDKFQHYEIELSLREKELAGLSEEDKLKKMKEVQTKFFGKEGADRIAQAQKEQMEQDKKISEYESKEKEFINQNPNLKGEALEKKLMELRVQSMGQEEAESYSRRKMLDEYNKSL